MALGPLTSPPEAALSVANILRSPGSSAAGVALVTSGLSNLDEWPADKAGWIKLAFQIVGGALAILAR